MKKEILIGFLFLGLASTVSADTVYDEDHNITSSDILDKHSNNYNLSNGDLILGEGDSIAVFDRGTFDQEVDKLRLVVDANEPIDIGMTAFTKTENGENTTVLHDGTPPNNAVTLEANFSQFDEYNFFFDADGNKATINGYTLYEGSSPEITTSISNTTVEKGEEVEITANITDESQLVHAEAQNFLLGDTSLSKNSEGLYTTKVVMDQTGEHSFDIVAEDEHGFTGETTTSTITVKEKSQEDNNTDTGSPITGGFFGGTPEAISGFFETLFGWLPF